MDHNICPPSPNISNDAHKAAYYRWCLDKICENVFTADMLKRGGLGLSSAREGHDKADKIISDLMRTLCYGTSDDQDPWDALWSGGFEAFKAYHQSQLATYHCGDCTAVASSCSRCIAETIYQLPSTVTWDRHTGHALLSAFKLKL